MPTDPRFRPALSVAFATIVAVFAFVAPARAQAPVRVPDADDSRDAPDQDHRQESEFFRRLAGGEIDAARIRQMWAESRALPSEPTQTDVVNTWQLAGPVFSVNPSGGFITGRVRDIDPFNIRALAASGGLWKFNIFGGIPMADNVPASWFGSFATSPLNSDVILLGTGEYRGGGGSGLYKTTDGGVTWTPSTMSPTPSGFSKVRWSADGATAYASSDNGFYRSTDGGDTWTLTLPGQVSDFSVTVALPGTIYATKVGLGVWRSTNDGVTWAQLANGGVPVNVAGIGAVSAVNFVLGGGIWIYVAFDTKLWRSTNGALSWTEVTPTNFGIGNSGYGPVLSANPNDPQTVLYGNVPYMRSENSGTNWTKIATGDLHADYHRFEWEANGTAVWAANDGGWSRSADRGVTWSSSSNAMPISQFYSIDCEKTEEGYMIGGTQDNNILYTPNPSLNWVDPALSSSEGDATGATIDLYNPQQMWAISGVSSDPIAYPRYHTTDGGTTWNIADNGIDPSTNGGSIRTDNAFPARLVTSTGPNVYESLDGGSTWAKSNPTPFPSTVASLTSSTRVLNGAVLYATTNSTTNGQRLFVRDNGTWVERSAGLPASQVVLKVVPHPWAGQADEAWAITTGFAGRIFHTTNRGVNWTNVTGDFPSSLPISDIVPNPRASGELYVGTILGCFRSLNGGVNWEHWNNGMPPAAIVSEMSYIDLTGTTGQFFVVASTYGRSVFRRDVSGGDVFPTLEVSNPVVAEGNSGAADTAWFRVHVPLAQSSAVTVDYSTLDGTAIAGSDYVGRSGTISFAPFQVDAWVGVAVIGDLAAEPDETFQLVLSNPLRAFVGSPGTATIDDDDFHSMVASDLFVTDGTVSAIAPWGNSIYIGGNFSHVGSASGCAVPLDASTGLPVSLPLVDGSVNAMVSDGAGGWFLGGNFLHVGGAPRTRLAHILADGSLSPWNPVANDYVFALALNAGNIFVGGRFTTLMGVPRNYLAAVSATTGLPTTWAPEPNDQVLALALSGATLYAGGSFTTIGGKSRNYAAAMSTQTANVTPWNPNANAAVGSLLFDGGPLLACGSFTNIGGQPRNYLAALDLGSGAATAWNPAPDNLVFALASSGANVYAGGLFSNIGGQPRANLAALDRTTGNATGWIPNPDGTVLAIAPTAGAVYVGGTFANIGGLPRNNLAAVTTVSGLATAWNPDPNSSVEVLGVSGTSVFAGGVFTSLAPQARGSLAAFDAGTRQLLPWNPNANGGVLSLVAAPGVLYAGGSFTGVDGQVRNRLAAIDSVSGHVTAWDPNASSTVRSMLVLGSKLYVGGSFTTMGGAGRNFGAAFLASTGALQTWNPNANATIFSIATDGTLIYAGGSFTSIGGQARNGLASLSNTSGAANPAWNPSPNAPVNYLMIQNTALFVCGTFTQIAGLPRTRLAVIDLSSNAVSTWNPAPNNSVFSIVPSGFAEYYIGGSFTAIGGQPRNHLALVRPNTNQVSSWAPEPDGNVNALALTGSVLYAGGAFTELGGLPHSHFAAIVPAATVGVPPPAPITGLALRVSPNPAAGRVRLEYDLPVAAHVSIAVYDVQGRRVGPAIEEQQEAGTHSASWEGAEKGVTPAGVYFVRLGAGRDRLVRRMVRL